MSPLKKQKLSKIRKELDNLDNVLIKIIKKRTNLVKRVLGLKEKKNQIVDQKRINLIVKNIKNYHYMINPNLVPFIDKNSLDMENKYQNFINLVKNTFS